MGVRLPGQAEGGVGWGESGKASQRSRHLACAWRSIGQVKKIGKSIPGRRNSMCKGIEGAKRAFGNLLITSGPQFPHLQYGINCAVD